jgi:5-methylthioadenosine/S-adenosylhomocysteine deaminase
MRVSVGLVVTEAATNWAANADECIDRGMRLRDEYQGDSLVSTHFAPAAPDAVSDATLVRVRRLADELDLPVHMHVHETAAEVGEAVAATGRRPLERLAELGLVTPSLIAVHATALTAADVNLLATGGASVVHCPRSNLKLASGLCPIAHLLDTGVNVALGTDGAASNNRLDLWGEMQTAALLAKQVAGDAAAVPAPLALRMATINGARALGLSDEIGSLVPGKAADVICVNLAGVEHHPLLDPVSHLVYAASRHDVSDVWVAGEHLVADGALLRLDVAEICAAAERWARQLQA